MSHEINLHKAQTAILRELLFHPHAGYTQMQKPTGLTSDHFNFHIKRLVEVGLVSKEARGRYKLSVKGKEYANRLDTSKNTIERQPKIAVLLNVERNNAGRREWLFQQRLKNPYYGFWGLPTGKVGWGETISEAAARELEEETGLSAKWQIAGVYHEHAYLNGNGELVEDKVFFVCHGTTPSGRLIVDFEGGHNEWLTKAEALKKDDVYPNFEIELGLIEMDHWFAEHSLEYEPQQF